MKWKKDEAKQRPRPLEGNDGTTSDDSASERKEDESQDGVATPDSSKSKSPPVSLNSPSSENNSTKDSTLSKTAPVKREDALLFPAKVTQITDNFSSLSK